MTTIICVACSPVALSRIETLNRCRTHRARSILRCIETLGDARNVVDGIVAPLTALPVLFLRRSAVFLACSIYQQIPKLFESLLKLSLWDWQVNHMRYGNLVRHTYPSYRRIQSAPHFMQQQNHGVTSRRRHESNDPITKPTASKIGSKTIGSKTG
jgi:hypothetical protein